ncbi:hypothetical protein ACFL0Q_06685, partial [Thermodesulfobacteriota bacterium]
GKMKISAKDPHKNQHVLRRAYYGPILAHVDFMLDVVHDPVIIDLNTLAKPSRIIIYNRVIDMRVILRVKALLNFCYFTIDFVNIFIE